MKRMKLDKTCTVCMILLLTVLLAACGRGSNQEAASEKPVDIVSEVAEVVSSETETTAMDETVQKNYKVLLDGTSDQEAVYYLQALRSIRQLHHRKAFCHPVHRPSTLLHPPDTDLPGSYNQLQKTQTQAPSQ